MNLRVNNINFKGPLDGFATGILRVCDTNEVVNAVGLDVGAMVVPRTYYDTKARNKYAGAETFFREISGTFRDRLRIAVPRPCEVWDAIRGERRKGYRRDRRQQHCQRDQYRKEFLFSGCFHVRSSCSK